MKTKKTVLLANSLKNNSNFISGKDTFLYVVYPTWIYFLVIIKFSIINSVKSTFSEEFAFLENISYLLSIAIS